jgi:hypothetical protein
MKLLPKCLGYHNSASCIWKSRASILAHRCNAVDSKIGISNLQGDIGESEVSKIVLAVQAASLPAPLSIMLWTEDCQTSLLSQTTYAMINISISRDHIPRWIDYLFAIFCLLSREPSSNLWPEVKLHLQIMTICSVK